MFTPITRFTAPLLILTAALAMTPVAASAQNGVQRDQADDSKRCQVADNAATQQGKAGDADMESTYSSCRLLNGYVGFGAHTNDGNSETQGYGRDEAMPNLRKPGFAGRSHSLDLLTGEEDGGGSNGRGRKLTTFNADRTGTDEFTQKSPDWQTEYRPAIAYASLAPENTSLLASRSFGSGLPATGGGVGGGGTTGGLDGGRNVVPPTLPIPAVPEPQTYLMMLAGIALLECAARSKSRK